MLILVSKEQKAGCEGGENFGSKKMLVFRNLYIYL